MKKYVMAVVGATGMVGSKFLKVLEERQLPVSEYYLFASKKSAGKQIEFMGKTHTVIELTPENIKGKGIQIALFSAGGSVSKEFAPQFAALGATVIDNSSQWRMYDDVPLVVPEVNGEEALNNHGIIANPNCSTIQAVVALKPLDDAFGIKRVVYSTYQAVSGAGFPSAPPAKLDLKTQTTPPQPATAPAPPASRGWTLAPIAGTKALGGKGLPRPPAGRQSPPRALRPPPHP